MKQNCLAGNVSSRSGAIAVLVAMILPMILALIVLFIGVAQIQLARAELRVSTDAAARAATESILRTQDENLSYQTASRVASEHTVINQGLTLEKEAVIFGQGLSHDGAEWEFIPNQQPFNAAQVTIVKSNQTQSGPVPLLLSMFGMSDFETAKTAIATQIDHDIMFVIEAGGSMHAPQRWKGVLAAFDQVIELTKTLGNRTRIGIIVCHRDPALEQELVQVSGQILVRLDEINDQVKNIKLVQGRNLGGGLELASNILKAEKSTAYVTDQTIVFLGNGNHNKGMQPVSAARLAAARRQVIYCLVFGHNSDKDGKMEAAALLTGGKFFDVQDHSILPEVLKEVIINPSIVLIR